MRSAIEKNGTATIILATGASQFDMIAAFIEEPDIDWSKVECFHLDEYVGLPIAHAASFRRYLKERFVNKVPAVKAFHFIDGEVADPDAEALRLARLALPWRIVGDHGRHGPEPGPLVRVWAGRYCRFGAHPPAWRHRRKPPS
ncbi:MAG: 6-phosphogluconolactonase [Rhodospirillales bacterium]|nr:6-phosphogluconolactonase [Rhodospirillales bacterium]